MASWRAEKRGLALVLALAVLAAVTDSALAGRPPQQTKPETKKPEHSKQPPTDDTGVLVDGFAFCANECVNPKGKAPSTGSPLKGALVSVTCINLFGLKTDYTAAKTNANGYFSIDLGDYDYSAFGVSNCKATLVSAPGPCHFVTDLNKGHSGAPLTKKKAVSAGGADKLVYTVGPFYTAPAKCGARKPSLTAS